MQLGILENDKLYLEYCPDVGGSIFKFQAKVKITGDGWWHIDWIAGKPLASVQVKLINGNINMSLQKS